LNISVETISGTSVVRVSGEVDMSNTASVESAAASAVSNRAHGMVLDLSDVTYLDSAGVRLLYHLESRLGMHQQRLVIVVPTGAQIIRTLHAAGVVGSLVLVSSVEAAIVAAQAQEQRESGANGTTG
jgi:anti-sigma B factor antagonist